MTAEIENAAYRCPTELAVAPPAVQRVIVVGSCMMEGVPRAIEAVDPGCQCGYFLTNHAGQLPAAPPHPIADYDFQIVQVPIRSVLPDSSYFRLSYADLAAYQALFDSACQNLRQLLAGAMRWNSEHGLLSFVYNFLLPQQNPMGRLLPRYDLRNPVYFIEKLNEVLTAEVAHYANAYVLDADGISSTLGRRFFQDDMVLQVNHGAGLVDQSALDTDRLETVLPIQTYYPLHTWDFVRAAWAEAVAMYRTVRQAEPIKLVVVDLDDTMWRGVAAEKDVGDVHARDIEGWPLGIAEALGYLRRRGILLAIVSKNDEHRARALFTRMYGTRLSLDDFVACKINWKSKPENLQEVLEEVNLLARNVLVIDDNPIEREAYQAAFPALRLLGGAPYLWRRLLLWAPETQVAGITQEATARTEMVRSQVEREAGRKLQSREEFLRLLDLSVEVFDVTSTEHPRFARCFELLNKTNQFNTIGRRWTSAECGKAFASGYRFVAFEVADRFTEYGLVGLMIVGLGHITQMVMSCRVFGLEAEIAALSALVDDLHARGIRVVSADLVDTEFNLPCRDVFARCGFARHVEMWRSAADQRIECPAHVRLIVQASDEVAA